MKSPWGKTGKTKKMKKLLMNFSLILLLIVLITTAIDCAEHCGSCENGFSSNNDDCWCSRNEVKFYNPKCCKFDIFAVDDY